MAFRIGSPKFGAIGLTVEVGIGVFVSVRVGGRVGVGVGGVGVRVGVGVGVGVRVGVGIRVGCPGPQPEASKLTTKRQNAIGRCFAFIGLLRYHVRTGQCCSLPTKGSAAALLGHALFKSKLLALGVSFCRGGMPKQTAQVDEVLLRGRAFF